MLNSDTSITKPSELEFVLLAAFLMSLVALSIDMMLPALPTIGVDLGAESGNSTQQVVSVLFLGLTMSQFFYGPLSDRIGRKPTVVIGVLIFVIGSLISALSQDFNTMLFGRLVQGAGVAAMRVVIVAIVRDQYEEAPMARIMSLAMSVFIIVPCVAPILGQGVLAVAHWRVIFIIFIVLGLFLLTWFYVRQPETHPQSRRIAFNLQTLFAGVREICSNSTAMYHTLASGFLHAAFFGYLMSSPQIFEQIYGVGNLFGVYFGVLSLALGVAALLNAKLVLRIGTEKLSAMAILSAVIFSTVLFTCATIADGVVPLWLFIALMTATFFSLGFSFGNLNAIAMQPLGHIAGIAASTLGLLSGLVSLAIGTLIGAAFDQTILPLAAGFMFTSGSAMVLIYVARRKPKAKPS